MSNNILTLVAEFNGLSINIVEYEGQRWLTAEQVGKALGYVDNKVKDGVLKLYERHMDEFEAEDSTTVKLTAVDGKLREMRIFSPTGCNLLGMFANTPRAKEFRLWAKRVLAQHSAEAAAVPATVDARLGRLEQAVETMASSVGQMAGQMGHMAADVGQMAVGIQVVLEQQDMTARYIQMLEINQRGKQPMTPEIAAKARALVAEGMSQSDAARLLRISRTSLQRAINGQLTMTERMSRPFDDSIAHALDEVIKARREEMLRRFARP